MANGDFNNVLTRLQAALPSSWFPSVAPVRDAILSGMSTLFATSYSALMLAKANMRIPTTTGYFLDLTAFDFFGLRFARLPNQTDAFFAAAIVKEIFRERVTRAGVLQAVADTTGATPSVFEPFRIQDTCAYGYTRYYGKVGAYGNLSMRGQAFLTSPVVVTGYPLNGYGQKFGGYGVGFQVYAHETGQYGPINEAAVFAAVENTKAAGVMVWVNFGPVF